MLLAALVWLEAQPKGEKLLDRVNQRRVADHAGVDPMTTSQVLRTLEARDLLERLPDEWDRRARVLRATDAGRERVTAATHAVEACDRAFFTPLGADAAALTAALRTLSS